MMKITLFTAFYMLLACSQPAIAPPQNSLPKKATHLPLTHLDTTKTYPEKLAQIKQQKQQLKAMYQRGAVSLDSVRAVFTELLVPQIIPYWYGTPWSFEGHTAAPNQGSIACGYFVSTTLQDVGLPLNRYRLAQKSPEDEAKQLGYGKEPLVLQGSGNDWLIAELRRQSLKDGLYFIGLGAGHVGYLLKSGDAFYAIHSNYVPPQQEVVMQSVESSVYASFSRVYLVSVTWNDGLVEAWVKG